MPSLLNTSADDPLGILSLLGPVASSGLTTSQPSDTGANMAAVLGAAGALAQAGAPTLGPPPTTAQAILGALGAGRSAALQTEILPFMAQRAQQQANLQQLDYDMRAFQFHRQLQYQSEADKAISALTGTSATTTQVPADLASLPDFQALPDASRVPAIQTAQQLGMSPDQAAQWARILMRESKGLQVDPKTGQVVLSSAGALGVGQVMPKTFADMAAKYGIKGTASDLMPNLQASAHYFQDQTTDNQGNLRNATLGYYLGPDKLKGILSGATPLPADAQDYLVGTNAPGTPGYKPTQFAGPGVPGQTMDTSGPDRLVPDIYSKAQVPLSIELQAIAAGKGSDNPIKAHNDFIQDYLVKKALQPTYTQTAPGVQISSTGQTSAAPTGTPTIGPLKDADRQRLYGPSGVIQGQPMFGKYDGQGNLLEVVPAPGEEPQISIGEDKAKLPVEQGGVGPAWRPAATWQMGAWTHKITEVPISRQSGTPPPDASGFAPLTGQVLQQQQALRSQADGDPRIKNFVQQLTYLGRINNLAFDPTRTATDDLAALNTYFNFMSPGTVVHAEGPEAILETGGPGQRVQSVIARMVGGRFLTPDTIQNITNTLNTEAEGARAGFAVAANQYRGMARKLNINPDLVTPDPDSVIEQYQKAWEDSRQRLSTGKGVGGQTAVPGAAPTVRAGTATPETPPAPVAPPNTGGPPKDRLSDAGLSLMKPADLVALGQDIQKNPGNYSPHDRQVYIDHVGRR